MSDMELPSAGIDASFAAAVRAYREERGWTQAELAALIAGAGVPDATQVLISRIEAGKRAIRLNEATAIARVFRVAIDDMTAESDAARLLAMNQRRARDAYVRFREAAADVTRWQARLHDEAEAVRGEVDTDDPRLALLLQNADNYVQYDLAREAREIVDAVRAEHEQNEKSRGGRFVNSTKRLR